VLTYICCELLKTWRASTNGNLSQNEFRFSISQAAVHESNRLFSGRNVNRTTESGGNQASDQYLRQWIKVFYTDISSCVLNNGYASKHFHLERGVRQGYPLSGTLFVIAIELLTRSIRRSKEIKGITIDEHNEVKLSQYADDTTVLLSDAQSLSKLFDLLSLFERCSGLKLNQTKSEMLWLGSMRQAFSQAAVQPSKGRPVLRNGRFLTACFGRPFTNFCA